MSLVVVDANTAAKWSLQDETLVEEAVALLSRYDRREIQFIVPDLFWAEFGNILWKAVRRGRCTRADADVNLTAVKDLNLTTIPSEGLIEHAFKIATRFDRTVYDSLYVALAVESRAQLVTADERLANAVAAHLPVKWLGAWA
ncbi:MAG TPA: type II toxin-antitoxin system VapC family toxin [Terriglobia bacterium]|nr:type II toxin-antitoxin system VapC family toxin [Terriglobia bacterium]